MSEISEVSEEEPYLHITKAAFDELDRLGEAIYEKLRPELERKHDRQFVTIHVDTEDYAIGKNSSTATRAIFAASPGGRATLLP